MNRHKIKIALDWTPNVNHLGIFMAIENGLYKQKDIVVEILSPLDDQYQKTPGKKVELGLADFAIAPFETVISLNNKANRVDAIAVYNIFQHDVSSIVTLQSSGILRPKQLDNKIYASYKARYEDLIVQKMIQNDGGEGTPTINYPEKLGIWNTLLENKADATWIFNNWESVEAETKGIPLIHFALKDFNIPYGFSPNIFTTNQALQKNELLFTNFIKATQAGYLSISKHVEKAASILKQYVPEQDQNNIDLAKSIAYSLPYFGKDEEYGVFRTQPMHKYLNWLVENNLESEQILNQTLYTNALIN